MKISKIEDKVTLGAISAALASTIGNIFTHITYLLINILSFK